MVFKVKQKKPRERKSIIEFKYKGRSGYIVERKNPYYSNNFVVYKDGSLGFDRQPSKKASVELIKLIKIKK